MSVKLLWRPAEDLNGDDLNETIDPDKSTKGSLGSIEVKEDDGDNQVGKIPNSTGPASV